MQSLVEDELGDLDATDEALAAIAWTDRPARSLSPRPAGDRHGAGLARGFHW
jgi:hypothetical protein